MTIPLWVLAYSGITAACADCDPFARHAHELLFGYALAVVGGFLFTKVGKGALAVAFICWLAARVAVFADLEPTPVTAALALAFPVCVFLFAGLPFLKAARTAHNAVFAPVLGAFMFAELVFQLGSLGWLTEGERRGVYLALDLVTLLLFVMGGGSSRRQPRARCASWAATCASAFSRGSNGRVSAPLPRCFSATFCRWRLTWPGCCRCWPALPLWFG